MPIAIDTEARHVGSHRRVGVGGIQDVQQAIVKGQADGTSTTGPEDAYQLQLAVVDVDNRDLVATGVDCEQPLPVSRADKGALCAVREGCRGRRLASSQPDSARRHAGGRIR